MRKFGAVIAILAVAGLAWFQGKPINENCPVKGTPIKAGTTSVYKGKTVGFC